jgi:hypothetical protein
MGEAKPVSKQKITRDDPDLGHLVPEGSDHITVLDGEDRIQVGAVYDPSGQAPTVIKSLRLPENVVEAIAASGHPDGFTGVVREALGEWFERHSGREAEAHDARAAIATLTRLVERLEAAA